MPEYEQKLAFAPQQSTENPDVATIAPDPGKAQPAAERQVPQSNDATPARK